MHPAHYEPLGSQRADRERGSFRQNAGDFTQQSSVRARRFGTEDSWIEISSQPSNTSVPSLNPTGMTTTGLQVQHNPEERRPRQLQVLDLVSRVSDRSRSTSAAGSSQDEYEESESESDRVLSSSNEDIAAAEDEDDTSTALGIGQGERHVFTPQPNAFSHPPAQSARSIPTPAPDSYFTFNPSVSAPASTRLASNRIPARPIPRPSARQPSHQTDHDAALRASLTTLLSCAAAVRSTPKEREDATTRTSRPNQPTSLRLVQRSEIEISPARNTAQSPPKSTSKRRSRESSKERQAKKLRAAKVSPEEAISPTLVTWMISAGVVLVFSAISFSAGYAWGREVGRFEGEMAMSTGSCGHEVLRSGGNSLKRLRWATTTPSIST